MMMNNSTFTPQHPLKTSVLFLVFNRLDTTKQVFEAIRQAKPPRLYIAADGARELQEGEDAKVKAIREYVISSIDWDCGVQTLFREENLGCKYAISGAIDWFFENEEMGIILEDDCLPNQSFFWYCEELLEKYKDDMRVWQIAGNSYPDGFIKKDFPYYFSVYGSIWGWATWRRAWQYYDVEMMSFNIGKTLESIENSLVLKNHSNARINIFNHILDKNIDTWDYQWSTIRIINSGLSIVPTINLISNIGFGFDATHTKIMNDKLANMATEEIELPISVNNYVVPNRQYDDFLFRQNYSYSILKQFIKIIFQPKKIFKYIQNLSGKCNI